MNKLECLVIGLGVFGKALAENLKNQGAIVVGLDLDEKNLRESERFLDQTVRADATIENNLRNLGIENFDYVFVCIGEHMQASLMVTLHLNNLGANKVVARSNSLEHSLILQKLGANQVITPEIETGRRLAHEISSSFESFMKLSGDIAVVQIEVPERMVGKSLGELDLRQKYKINILTIKKNLPFINTKGEETQLKNIEEMPSPDYYFNRFDRVYIMGTLNNIERFIQNFKAEDNEA